MAELLARMSSAEFAEWMALTVLDQQEERRALAARQAQDSLETLRQGTG